MTRINLVPAIELMDQHLFAEFREIKMVPKSLARSIAAAQRRASSPFEYVLERIPKQFTLNKGHVSFFYDKGLYLQNRYTELRKELMRRGVNFDRNALLDPDSVFARLPVEQFSKTYTPTDEALHIIRTRIAEKIAMKPTWYRYHGTPNDAPV